MLRLICLTSFLLAMLATPAPATDLVQSPTKPPVGQWVHVTLALEPGYAGGPFSVADVFGSPAQKLIGNDFWLPVGLSQARFNLIDKAISPRPFTHHSVFPRIPMSAESLTITVGPQSQTFGPRQRFSYNGGDTFSLTSRIPEPASASLLASGLFVLYRRFILKGARTEQG